MTIPLAPSLAAKNLAIGFGSRNIIAGGLDLTVEPGELVFLLGPNGVGKTTLLKTLAGLSKPIEGHVEFEGVSIATLPRETLAKRRSIVLTQQPAVSSLRAREVVSLGRLPYVNWSGSLGPADEEATDRAMHLTGCAPLADRLISRLSDGERQKVYIARAIAQDTPLIMLDEPTAFIDLPRRVEIVQLLRQLTREFNKAVILSTHDLDLALMAADRIWLLSERGTFATGLPEELVLSGDLKRTFHSEDILFDESTGRFAWNNTNGQPIEVRGNGLLATWTKRVIDRLGYQIVPGASLSIDVITNPDTWTLIDIRQSHSFTTLADLSRHLRNRDKHHPT